MGGTVVVKDQVSGSPAAATRRGQAELSTTLKAGQAAWAKLTPQTQGKTVIVPLIGNIKTGYTINRFTRKPLVITRGTTVTWQMRDPFEIHTVTFTSGAKPAEFVAPQPQPGGPPKLLAAPEAVQRTSETSYDGTGYANSGILFAPGAPGNPPTSYSLTFTKPGQYTYYCLVHIPYGMIGQVTVK